LLWAYSSTARSISSTNERVSALALNEGIPMVEAV
jgi:hypothetical protein